MCVVKVVMFREPLQQCLVSNLVRWRVCSMSMGVGGGKDINFASPTFWDIKGVLIAIPNAWAGQCKLNLRVHIGTLDARSGEGRKPV
jgi:hypothetical protein